MSYEPDDIKGWYRKNGKRRSAGSKRGYFCIEARLPYYKAKKEVIAQEDVSKRIEELEVKLRDLNARLPSRQGKQVGMHVHADPIDMIMKVEELEDEISSLKAKQQQ